MQTTLKTAVTLKGTALHSGVPVTMTIAPAHSGTGIRFRRTDLVAGNPIIQAIWSNVRQEPLCTTLINEDGVLVATVEHVMAALAGCGVHNAMVEVSGPETPILDGSSAPFAKAILAAGLRTLRAPVQALRVLRPVMVEDGQAWARLLPSDRLHISFEIDFPEPAIGHQQRSLDMSNGAFLHELCDSRTFCRLSDVELMRSMGKGLGGSLDNAVVIEGVDVLTPGGLRHKDEPVRHKMLDALGDLALAGGPLLGRYVGHRAGHSMTNALLRRLFATPGAVDVVECDAAMLRRLPGVGVSLSDLPAVA